MVMNVLTRHGLQTVFDQNSYGDLLVLASAACWALYSVFSKSLINRIGGYAAITWVMIAGALELFILRWFWPTPAIWPDNYRMWLAVIYLALFPTALGFLVWYEAMRLIKMSLLNVMQYLTPVCTVLLAWALLGERMTIWQLTGIGVVTLGIMLVSWRRGVRLKN